MGPNAANTTPLVKSPHVLATNFSSSVIMHIAPKTVIANEPNSKITSTADATISMLRLTSGLQNIMNSFGGGYRYLQLALIKYTPANKPCEKGITLSVALLHLLTFVLEVHLGSF
jgi:hypothetical protein